MLNKKISLGFSLIELSIVLVVVGLVLGGLINSISVFVENARISKTKSELEIIRESITGFAIDQGRLPCPSDWACSGSKYVPDGDEDISAGVCNKEWGFIPYKELGIDGQDIWGNYYIYRIANGFNSIISTTSVGNIEIYSDEGLDSDDMIANHVAVVVYSVGANRGLGLAGGGSVLPSSQEAENFNSECSVTPNATVTDEKLVYKEFVPAGAAQDEFDDVMIWISEYLVKARLSQAGVL